MSTPSTSPLTISHGAQFSRILGVGGYRPRRVVDNAEIVTYIDSSDEWIQTRSGIKERRWASPDETRASVLELWERVRAHSEQTVAELPLDAPGVVPWWAPDKRDVTLHQVLVHLLAEASRHAGHADVVRELLDGQAGMRRGGSNLPEEDEAWWRDYRVRLEQAAEAAQG